MAPAAKSRGEQGRPIARMASHPVAAGIPAAGADSLSGPEREAWPVAPLNTVEIPVAYPGASSPEVADAVSSHPPPSARWIASRASASALSDSTSSDFA